MKQRPVPDPIPSWLFAMAEHVHAEINPGISWSQAVQCVLAMKAREGDDDEGSPNCNGLLTALTHICTHASAFVDSKSTYPQIYKCIQYAMWAAGLPGNSQRPHCSTYMWFYTRICAWRSPRYLAAARGVAFPCLDHVSIQC